MTLPIPSVMMVDIMIASLAPPAGRQAGREASTPRAQRATASHPPHPYPPRPLPVANLITGGGGVRLPVPLTSPNAVVSLEAIAPPPPGGDPETERAPITEGDPFLGRAPRIVEPSVFRRDAEAAGKYARACIPVHPRRTTVSADVIAWLARWAAHWAARALAVEHAAR